MVKCQHTFRCRAKVAMANATAAAWLANGEIACACSRAQIRAHCCNGVFFCMFVSVCERHTQTRTNAHTQTRIIFIARARCSIRLVRSRAWLPPLPLRVARTHAEHHDLKAHADVVAVVVVAAKMCLCVCSRFFSFFLCSFGLFDYKCPDVQHTSQHCACLNSHTHAQKNALKKRTHTQTHESARTD